MSIEPLLAYGALGIFAVIWLGLCVGSFLNVVIHRLPIMLERQWNDLAHAQLFGEHITGTPAAAPSPPAPQPQQAETTPDQPFDLMRPRSRCPGCGSLIRAWQNVPVISWLWLRGRCANCQMPISARYPLVEVLTALLSVAIVIAFGFSGYAIFALIFTWALIAATFIDFDTQLLPDQLTLPLLWLGLISNIGASAWAGPVSLADAVIGAMTGYLFLWTTYWAFKLTTGKDGMGYGDFKLLGAIGAWLGWQVLPGVILIASLAGLCYALIGIVGKGQSRSVPIPFGPFLAVGGWVCLIFRDTVVGFLFG